MLLYFVPRLGRERQVGPDLSDRGKNLLIGFCDHTLLLRAHGALGQYRSRARYAASTMSSDPKALAKISNGACALADFGPDLTIGHRVA